MSEINQSIDIQHLSECRIGDHKMMSVTIGVAEIRSLYYCDKANSKLPFEDWIVDSLNYLDYHYLVSDNLRTYVNSSGEPSYNRAICDLDALIRNNPHIGSPLLYDIVRGFVEVHPDYIVCTYEAIR